MSTAVLSSSSPFRRPNRDTIDRDADSPIPSTSSTTTKHSRLSPEPTSRTFHRFRSTLEQSIRTATRSKKTPAPNVDEFAVLSAKGKERAKDKDDSEKSDKLNMLRRVTFRRRESATPSPVPPLLSKSKDKDSQNPTKRDRVAGITSFITPSLRQASISSPALHLSSQALPSPKSQPAVPLSSTTPADGLVSPTRQRTRPSVRISTPVHLSPRDRDKEPVAPNRHRSTKSASSIPTSPSTPSLPLHHKPQSNSTSSPAGPPTPRKDRDRDPRATPTPTPDTPTPRGNSSGQLARSPSASVKPSITSNPRASSSAIRPRSPSNSSSARPIHQVTPPRPTRGLTSASTSHLPLHASSNSPSPPPSPTTNRRRPSIDASPSARRPSIDSTPLSPRRSSIDAPARRPSIDATPRRSSRDSPAGVGLRRNESPSPSPASPVRPRAISPTQRSYAQNRHFNISSGSLVLSNNIPASVSAPISNHNEDSTPTSRDLIRTAISLIVKQVDKPPAHMCRTEQGIKDWEEVESRTKGLVRLERVWMTRPTTVAVRRGSVDGAAIAGNSTGGEDKERRMFCEALRDGYVLCQLMNKLRQSSIVRPDAREDGVVRTANVTKFLAACASYGLPSEDIFSKDDLTLGLGGGSELEATRDAAVRVAKTVIRLVGFVEESEEDRTREREKGKWIRGGGLGREREREREAAKERERERELEKKLRDANNPYGSTSSRGSTSTPNLLLHHQLFVPPSSPVRKRWSPPEDMTPLRSSSPEGSGSGSTEADKTARGFADHSPTPADEDPAGGDAEFKLRPVPTMMKPPPRSPLRHPSQSSPSPKRTDGTAAGSSVLTSPPSPSPHSSKIADAHLRTIGPRRKVSAPISIAMSSDLDSVADSTRASMGDVSLCDDAAVFGGGGNNVVHQRSSNGFAAPPSPTHPPHPHRSSAGGLTRMRQSIVSSALSETDTTITSAKSSLLDGGRNSLLSFGGAVASNGAGGWSQNGAGGGGSGMYGTIRTVTTDLTSEAASLSRTEGSMLSEELEAMSIMTNMKRRQSGEHVGMGNGYGGRERKMSGAALLDLSRVAEEAEESGSSKGRHGLAPMQAPAPGPYGKRLPMALQGRSRSQEVNVFGGDANNNNKHPPMTAVHLRQGKWPDDFLDAFSSTSPDGGQTSAQSQPQSIPTSKQSNRQPHLQVPHQDSNPNQSPSAMLSTSAPVTKPISISPPRKLAIVGGGARRVSGGTPEGANDPSSSSSLASQQNPLPRRPTHRPRNSLDGSVSPSVLLPKESILRREREREASPDSNGTTNGRAMLRRHSTKPGSASGSPSPSQLGMGIGNGNGNGVTGPSPPAGRQAVGGGYVPRSGNGNGTDGVHTPSSRDSPVPFPRSVSVSAGDYAGSAAAATPSPRSSVDGFGAGVDRPNGVRGRFQSDVEGSARRKVRPNSFDELGAGGAGGLGGGGAAGRRSRFESMVNLGVASGTTSASDLMARDSRDSIDGSAVRMRLVVREDGKPPTHFQLGNCIGRGQFGSVYRALNLNTGQMVAVKRIRLEGLKEEEVTTLMREVDLVKSLSHPSIVKYEGMARDDNTLSIVLEYAENGSLGQTLKSFGKLNEKLVASYVVKILEGLHYLHTSDVVHCDLKAANILTTKNGNVKLSDFGVSLNLRAMEREIKDVAGTPNWMAPEVIELKGASTKSDIWSLGCTVIELLTGRPPYAEIANSMSVMFRIVEDHMPPMPEGCSELLKDFLEQCFHKDPTRRPDAELLCEHPWLKNNWVALKELRPQDSIPFLRRVSTDLHKSDAVRHLAQLDLPESPVSASPKRDHEMGKASPIGRRTSASSVRPGDNEFSPREHTFVKTTFSKPMVCRVCLSNVKKSAVLCSQCSLISHAKCAVNAPPTCDLRAQLLLYAQYAEKGNPTSGYNPADALGETKQNMAMPDVPFVEQDTPRTSVDYPPPSTPIPVNAEHAPTAFKFMAAFRRSRSNLSPEPISASTSSTPLPPLLKDDDPPAPPVKRRVLQKRQERPQSMASESTGLSSLRSAATAAESFSSRQNTGQRSHISGSDKDREKEKAQQPVPGGAGVVLERGRSSKVPPRTSRARSQTTTTTTTTTTNNDYDDTRPNDIPGGLSANTRDKAKKATKSKSSSSSSCNVQ